MTAESYCESGDKSSLAHKMLAREKSIPGMDFFKQIEQFTTDFWLEVEDFQEVIDQRYFDLYIERDIIENCKERLTKEYATLRIIIKEPTLLKIIQNIRVSFADKLGIAGGTIGLFTGLSLISIVETCYWILRWLLEKTKKLAAQKRSVRGTSAFLAAQRQESQERDFCN